jgi:endonuclease/exonuclease/phosphatase (EEP) superfamily protein YafD
MSDPDLAAVTVADRSDADAAHPAPPGRDDPGVRRRSWRKLPGPVVAVLWAVVGLLGVVLLLRLFAWDDLEPFAVLNTLTWIPYVPAWIVLAVAVYGRRYALAAAAVALVAAQVGLAYPELSANQAPPAWTSASPSFPVLDANVYEGNPSMDGYARQIRGARPGLVTLEEATPPDVAQLRGSGALDGLPYQFTVDRYDPWAFLIASRYPLEGTHVLYRHRLPFMVQTTVALPTGPERLWVVHTIAPLPASFDEWTGQLAAIGAAVHRQGTAHLLVVGDFNATWGNRGFRQVLDEGMTDGAAARGDALATTWSQTAPLVPPLVRIDHVLTGAGTAVTSVRTAEGEGSDHRELLAEVAFRR